MNWDIGLDFIYQKRNGSGLQVTSLTGMCKLFLFQGVCLSILFYFKNLNSLWVRDDSWASSWQKVIVSTMRTLYQSYQPLDTLFLLSNLLAAEYPTWRYFKKLNLLWRVYLQLFYDSKLKALICESQGHVVLHVELVIFVVWCSFCVQIFSI